MAKDCTPEYLASAHALVRALKAPADPPRPEWPRKFDIAAQAAQAEDLYLPNKTEILRDWVLDLWARTKPAACPNALLDPGYHRLLVSLDRGNTHLEPSLVTSYLGAAKQSVQIPDRLHSIAARTFATLNDKRTEQVKPEQWVQVWTLLLDVLSVAQVDESWVDLWTFVTCQWTPENTPESRKKLSSLLVPSIPLYAAARNLHPLLVSSDSFFVSHLLPWTCLQTPDALNLILDSLPKHPSIPIINFLPVILQHAIKATVKDRYRIFSQPSSSRTAFDVFVADKIRSAIRSASAAVLASVQGAPSLSSGWKARAEIWKAIREWGGYLETDGAWASLVESERTLAISALGLPIEEAEARSSALDVLQQLELVDHQRANLGVDVVGWCLTAPPAQQDATERLLTAMIRYHRLTRSLGEYLESLDEASANLLSACDSSRATKAIYDLIINGVLGRSSFTDALAEAVGSTGQRRGIVHAALVLVGRLAGPTAEASGESAKRRKVEESNLPVYAAQAGIRSRLIQLVLSVSLDVRRKETPQSTMDEIASAVCQFESVPLQLRESNKTRWSADVILASQLRLANCLSTRGYPIPDRITSSVARDMLSNPKTLLETQLQIIIHHCWIAASKRPGTDRADLDAFVGFLTDHVLAPASVTTESEASARATATCEILAACHTVLLNHQNLSVVQCFKLLQRIDQIVGSAPNQGAKAAERIISSAEFAESPVIRASIDKYLESALATLSENSNSPLVAVLLPLASKESRALAFTKIFSGDKLSGGFKADFDWATECVERGDVDRLLSDLDAVVRIAKLVAGVSFTESSKSFLTAVLVKASRKEKTDDVLEILDEGMRFDKVVKKVNKGGIPEGLWAVVLFFEQIDNSKLTFTTETRRKLVDHVDALVKGLIPLTATAIREPSTRSLFLSAWLASLRLGRSQGQKVDQTVSAELLQAVATPGPEWTVEEQTMVMCIIHEETRSNRSGSLILSSLRILFSDKAIEPSLLLSLSHGDAADLTLLVQTACKEIIEGPVDKIDVSLKVLAAAFNLPRDDVSLIVRPVLLPLLERLIGSLAVPGFTCSSRYTAALAIRQLAQRHPFTFGPREIPLTLEYILQQIQSPSLPRQTFQETLGIFTSLLRHRRQILAGEAPLVVGICSSVFAHFVVPLSRRRPLSSCSASERLDVEDATATARTLSMVVNDKPHSTTQATHSQTLASSIVKHAPSILIAYIRAIADPRGKVDPAVRRELVVGLNEICDLVTVGGRVTSRGREGEALGDAFGLGEGPGGEAERDVWANMWGSWASKRYTGQG